MDSITEKVYLGNFLSARDEENLIKNNFTGVLSCTGEGSPQYQNKSIKHKIFAINDTDNTNIIQYFKEALKFIDKQEKVLVHCLAGFSRSATLVIAYFMWKNKLTYDKSYNMVFEHRIIGPNKGFIKQLKIFEEKLIETNYDLNKIDFESIQWPKKKTS